MRGADLLVKTLHQAGIARVFSLSGNQIMPVYDACIDLGIEIVHTRHEAAAVFMADAYAQLTGQVGVALVTAGPGFANALGPLVATRALESPVLLLSGDASIKEDGRGAFQELAQTGIAEALTKGSFRAATTAGLGDDAARALRLAATGRPGPVHLGLPVDLLEADVDLVDFPHDRARLEEGLPPSLPEIEEILVMVRSASRPLILTGPALNRTRGKAQLDGLRERLDMPVISMESPRGLKDASLGDLRGVLGEADLILCLGKSIDFSLGFGAHQAFAEDCRWIVVESDEDALNRAQNNLDDRLALSLKADPKATIGAMIELSTNSAGVPAWRDEVEARCEPKASATSTASPSGRLSPIEVCAAVQRQIDRQTSSIAILDGGEFCQWAQAGLRADERLTNGPAGAIGGGLCYAVAAKLARPEATVFAMMGDGTVGFHLAEFETAVRIGTPFVAVIGNDSCWNAEHQIQLRDYGPDRLIGCELTAARYDLVVEGLGGHGEYVTKLTELDEALARAVKSGKPACVNIEIEGMPAPGGVPH